MLQNDICQILEYARWAPSAENNQPWLIKILDSYKLQILLNEKKVLKFEPNNILSFISIGTFLKTLEIAALNYNYNIEIKYLLNKNVIANIKFYKDNTVKTCIDLECIKKRITNRKKYENKKIPRQEITTLIKIACKYKDLSLYLIENHNKKKRIAYYNFVAESARFQNKLMHQELFENLKFQNEEEGLWVKTLEIGFTGEIILKFIKNWKVLEIFNNVSFNKLLAFPSYLNLKNSPLIGIITCPHPSPVSYLRTGQLLQEIWLYLTKENISLHPYGALPVFLNYLINQNNKKNNFLPLEIEQKLKLALAYFISFKQGIPLIVFRIGYASPPLTRSRRKKLKQLLLI